MVDFLSSIGSALPESPLKRRFEGWVSEQRRNASREMIDHFLNDLEHANPASERYKAAEQFLFDSEERFNLVCGQAGIDGRDLRKRLLASPFAPRRQAQNLQQLT
jgi:hypothetical protein